MEFLFFSEVNFSYVNRSFFCDFLLIITEYNEWKSFMETAGNEWKFLKDEFLYELKKEKWRFFAFFLFHIIYFYKSWKNIFMDNRQLGSDSFLLIRLVFTFTFTYFFYLSKYHLKITGIENCFLFYWHSVEVFHYINIYQNLKPQLSLDTFSLQSFGEQHAAVSIIFISIHQYIR